MVVECVGELWTDYPIYYYRRQFNFLVYVTTWKKWYTRARMNVCEIFDRSNKEKSKNKKITLN